MSGIKICQVNFQMGKHGECDWEIGEDAFTFKIKLYERPLTKRVMLSVISSSDSLEFGCQ